MNDRTLVPQAIRFIFVGLANTLVTYVIFFALGLVMEPWIAYTIAFFVGLLWVVFGSSRIVFKAETSPVRLVKFAAWYLAVFSVGQLVVYFTKPEGPLGLAITSIAVLLVTTPLGFLGGRLIFRARPKEDEARP